MLGRESAHWRISIGRLHKMVGRTRGCGTCAMVKEMWGMMGKLGKMHDWHWK